MIINRVRSGSLTFDNENRGISPTQEVQKPGYVIAAPNHKKAVRLRIRPSFSLTALYSEREAGTAQRPPERMIIRYRYAGTARHIVRMAVYTTRAAALMRL